MKEIYLKDLDAAVKHLKSKAVELRGRDRAERWGLRPDPTNRSRRISIAKIRIFGPTYYPKLVM